MLQIKELDHIVLRSPDIERSLSFYCGLLGMSGVRLEEWRSGDAPFPSVRVSDGTIIDLTLLKEAPGPDAGQRLDHFCLVLEPTDLDAVAKTLEDAGYAIGARGNRFGARGRAESVYITGPEGVTVELRQYVAVSGAAHGASSAAATAGPHGPTSSP